MKCFTKCIVLLCLLQTVAAAGAPSRLKFGEKEAWWGWWDWPIRCTYTPSLTAEQLASFEIARTVLNSSVGKDLIAACVPDQGGSRRGVLLDSDLLPGAVAGQTSFDSIDRHSGRIRYATVTLEVLLQSFAPEPVGLMMAVWLHELGHLIGLDHDDQKGSIMNPSVDVDLWFLPEHIRLMRQIRAFSIRPANWSALAPVSTVPDLPRDHLPLRPPHNNGRERSPFRQPRVEPWPVSDR